jgi:hypothetical protein
LKSSYLYGSFDFGEGFERMIFGYPLGDQCVSQESPVPPTSTALFVSTQGSLQTPEIAQVLLPIDYKSCILSGIATEKLKFQDRLTSSTFILQIHTDDLCDRVFSTANVNSFNEKYINQPAGVGAVTQVDPTPKQPSPRGNTKKNKKDTAAAATASSVAAAPAPSGLVRPSSESYQEKDEVVWSWITTALKNSPRLLSYGSVRCRLDSLLRTSTDRLLDFQALQNRQSNTDMTVVISVSPSSLPPSSSPSLISLCVG